MQLLNTIKQISLSESTPTSAGLWRHLCWQIRKTLNQFPVELQLSSSRITIDRSTGTGALVNCMGMYDFNNMNFIQLLLRKTSCRNFFDIGANIGSYTLIASEINGSHTFSFEPHPVTFNLLEQNIKLNHRENVVPFDAAVSDRTGDKQLTNKVELSTNALILNNSVNTESIPVKTKKLDDVCRDLKTWPNILKIDVEGHELSVLKGFQNGIKHAEVVIVERGDKKEIKHWMNAADLKGPFWIHFSRKTLSSTTQERKEDPVYLSPSGLNKVEELDFQVIEE